MNYASLSAELGIIGVIRGNELRARCPLHLDANPSFSLNLESGLWICFSKCGGGEFTNLVEQVLSLNPQEAREWVLSNGRRTTLQAAENKLALELHQKPDSPFFVPSNTGWLAKYNSLDHNVMPMWFLERGFTWDTIFRWDIRYDPIWDAVTIPVKWDGEIVGTVTRNTNPKFPKYQNSPNLPRSNVFFGEINSNENHIILVEGVLDTLWLWQNGYNVGGLLGTDLSEEQLRILQGFRFGEIVLGLDNDDAGIKGTKEAVSRLTKAGWLLSQLSFIQFPKGIKDAQDCDAELFAQLYEQRKAYLRT